VQLFIATAGMFGLMALYGYWTRTDLTQYHSLLYMALWGVIISLIINLFVGSSQLQMLTSAIGVLLFSALTAYDIQVIRRFAVAVTRSDGTWHKVAIVCALQLYLDFINLFLNMLQIFGKRK
jgi:FtsH-binding integral membrane protein